MIQPTLFPCRSGIAGFITRIHGLLILLVLPVGLVAQDKLAKRYEIDAKRSGVALNSKEALPRGREFKRLDSTYYVGWLLEGAYRFEHAADLMGFQSAALQLERALPLLENDFKTEIRTRTQDVMTYIRIMRYHRDWDFAAYALMQCYSNTDEPMKEWKHLQHCRQINLQDELYCDTYNFMAWMVHRNRFYTNTKYPFLKKSIDENERYANLLTDSAAWKIRQDAALNKTFFGDKYEQEKMPAVWHYKSILFTYQLNIPSGAYYYEKLRPTHYFPNNNYATFCAIQGKFREAESYYLKSRNENPGDKRLNESSYYLSILRTYKNENQTGIKELKDLIRSNGSTPGYGWYNIALARALYYNGQTSIAQRYLQRAMQFKEIHIGTTLGQSHYAFTTSLLQVLLKQKEIASVYFLHKDWWYSPAQLKKILTLTIEKYGLQFLLINQFAENPERDRVIYKLFSTESTVSFDEIYQLIEGCTPSFFLQRFQQELSKDKRPEVRRYIQLIYARLLIRTGAYRQAEGLINQLLKQPEADVQYEKLFLARCMESLYQCEIALHQNELAVQYALKLYALYPQLIPYTAVQLPMKLDADRQDPLIRSTVQHFEACRITWLQQTRDEMVPVVHLQKIRKQNKSCIQLSVTQNGYQVVAPVLLYPNADDASTIAVAFYLFGIGNDDKGIPAATR